MNTQEKESSWSEDDLISERVSLWHKHIGEKLSQRRLDAAHAKLYLSALGESEWSHLQSYCDKLMKYDQKYRDLKRRKKFGGDLREFSWRYALEEDILKAQGKKSLLQQKLKRKVQKVRSIWIRNMLETWVMDPSEDFVDFASTQPDYDRYKDWFLLQTNKIPIFEFFEE